MPLPRWFKSTLRAKLIVAFLTVTLVPLGVLGFLNAFTIRHALIKDANEKLLGAAKQTANSLEAFLRANLDAMRTEAQLPLLATYLHLAARQQRHPAAETEVSAILRALSRKDPLNISSYALLDRQGQTLIATLAEDIGTDQSHRSYVQVPFRTGLPYVSPIQFSPTVPGQASLYFSSPVRDANGKTVGILAARYNAAVLQQLLIQTNGLAGEQSFAVLLDEYHFRIAHGIAPELLFTALVPQAPDQTATLKTMGRWPFHTTKTTPVNLPELKRQLAALTSDHVFLTTCLVATGRVKNSVAISRLETQPWVVIFAQPQDIFLAPIQAQTRNTFILAAVIAAGVAGAAIFLVYTLAVPVVRLTQAAESVARGDLTAQAHVKSHDEIGILATTFNSMTRQLRDTMDGLEQRIAERTQAERMAQAHATRLHTLANLNQVISSSMHQESVLDDISKAAGQLMGVPFVTFWVVDKAAQRLEARAFSDGEMGPDFPLQSLSFDEGAVGWVAKHQCMVNIPDITRDARFVNTDWWTQHDLHSFVGMPIVNEQELLAILVLGGSTPFEFGAVEQSVLDSFIAQAAITLQNAQLFQHAQTQTRHLARINAELHREINERTWTEMELRRRTVQLEAANDELDAFAYSISHDLRAPLRSLSGFSCALLEDYHDKLTGHALDYLTRIDRASQRMGQMIDDLLTLSRSTRGELRWEWVDLSALATTIVAELGDYAPERQVTWEIEPQVVTQGDPRLLRIVLENLLNNAWKFTSKQDTATIAFGTQHVDGATVYSVRDDGVGFDMAYADKLFGIFQRLHTMHEFEGTGIGLATVARLVHRHGGRVWADGQEDQGATFYFTL
ncbi:MAG: hypothetical protein ETSY1_40465 [Candidatus Entotheonella factor]|uniref:histidine kinase n=1 Tax=Entotheonella factor TaxID=1429438 RepID=W4L631_ENTF1|nr:MAG: hypothetical protein ETSY1_40465 [Candidatus Entotheonella factor]